MRKQLLGDTTGKLINRNRLTSLSKCSIKLFPVHSRFDAATTVAEVSTAARQPGSEISQQLAIRRTDDPDQLILILDLTATQAGTLRLAANLRHLYSALSASVNSAVLASKARNTVTRVSPSTILVSSSTDSDDLIASMASLATIAL